MGGTAFFSEKSCSLSLGFFKLSLEECTVGVTNPWNWVLPIHSSLNEQNVQAQKKLYNKIRSMPSKSSTAIKSTVPLVNKM